MRWLFWISVGTVLYTYLGYPLILYFLSRWRTRPVRREPIMPAVSIILAVHNEEQVLPEKLRNLGELDYPQDRLEAIIISDGSTDGTNAVLRRYASPVVRPILVAEHRGKAAALNLGIEEGRGEVLVFTDARQRIEPNALTQLVAAFADPQVGCVSGELMLAGTQPRSTEGAGLYWRIEKKIRRLESLTGSVVGASGALYAVRRSLVVPLPQDTVLDDLYIPMQVVRQGARIVFEPEARAWDRSPASLDQEFRRKIRTLSGNYQILQDAPWLLSLSNPLLFRFINHKLLRLLVPFALAGSLASSLVLNAGFYRLAMLGQLMFYSVGLLGFAHSRIGIASRPANAVLTFVTLNVAAFVAFLNFITGNRPVWRR